MQEYQSELVLDCKCRLGEGPAWFNNAYTERDNLWWVDLTGESVHRFDPETGEHNVSDYEDAITAVVPNRGRGVTFVTENGIASFAGPGEPLGYHVKPEEHLPRNRFNDAKCDPQGRLWAGTMSRHGEDETGSLYMIRPDGTYEKRVEHITCSNGLAWHSDNRTFYYIDTPTLRVDAFDFDPETGNIANRRAVVTFPDGIGCPDGMTIDVDNKLWVGMWGGGAILHCDPETGEILGRVSVGAKNVTSCTFGGPSLTDLYITTARDNTSDEELAGLPYAGGLFVARTGAKGRSTNAFGK